MTCTCSGLPDGFYLDEASKAWHQSLVKEQQQAWTGLFQCPHCGTLWAIDEWDKYHWQVALRVRDRDGWASDHRTVERKELLLKSRGGTTTEICMWAGCSKPRVNGVVYCIDHLYDTGERR